MARRHRRQHHERDVRVAPLIYPHGVVLTENQIYVAESAGTTGSDRILRLASDGGAPIPLTTNRLGPSKPVTGGTRIYWFENGGTSTGPIYSMPLAGGALASHAITAIDPSMVIDGTVFYYGNATGGIVKIDVGAATVTTLYSSAMTGTVYGSASLGARSTGPISTVGA